MEDEEFKEYMTDDDIEMIRSIMFPDYDDPNFDDEIDGYGSLMNND